MQRTDATSWVETKGHGIHLSGGQCMAMNESCSVRVAFLPSGTEGRKTTLTEQDDRRMQKILPAVRRDTQEIQAWLNYLNGCNERMQQVGLKRRVTEFTSVVDNTWRWTNLVWSVLGQPLNGILWRCIPSRTPVSSGLRTTKTFPTYANEKIFATKHHTYSSWSTDVILAIRRDTQEILWNLATWADDPYVCNERMLQVGLQWCPGAEKAQTCWAAVTKKQTFRAIKASTDLPENIFAFGQGGRGLDILVEVLIFWKCKPDKARWFTGTTSTGRRLPMRSTSKQTYFVWSPTWISHVQPG